MAQGDVKAGIASVAAGAMWTIQPPAGEHWLVKRITSMLSAGTAPDVIPDTGLELFDGTIPAASRFGDVSAPENSARLYQRELNIGVNNTVYFRIRNSAGGVSNLGYSAIQIK